MSDDDDVDYDDDDDDTIAVSLVPKYGNNDTTAPNW